MRWEVGDVERKKERRQERNRTEANKHTNK
jgi:hypothetical protein